MRQLRPRAQAAAQVNSEAAARLAILDPVDGPEADVVNSQPGVVVGAAFECNLELSTKVLVVLVAHQVTK